MAVDNRIQTRDGLKDVDQPWKEFHDVSTTEESVAKMLADGTPNWVKWPADYKEYAREEFQKHREDSEFGAQDYKIEDQAELTNKVARMVNPMSTRDFIAKLRRNGVKCFTVDNGFPPNTVALWCLPPNLMSRARYICYAQVPAMYEWSVLKTDRYGKPMGEDFRGWRTVAVQLIEKEILTEAQVNKIFGNASHNKMFRRYHRSLWEIRNRKKFSEVPIANNDI